MADGLTYTGLRDAYAAASPARRLVWGGLILLLLVLPAVLLWKGAQTPGEYRVLFAGLSDRDGGEVVEALERLHIPYRLSEADGSVEVPSHDLHVARYKLAAQGLPRGDKALARGTTGPRFGLSPYQERLGHQRGLEAELAHSLESVEGVESARVHLALPRQSSFLRERIPPAASVLVKLRQGAAFGDEKVEALRQIVAGGVPGMSPGQISIVDQSGALLAAGMTASHRDLSPDQLEYARRLESDLAARVERVLAPVLGDTAFRVQVTAGIDFGENEETSDASRRSLRQVSTLIVVDEHGGNELAEPDRLAALARQAIGFDGERGDSLQVIMLPFPVVETPVVAAPQPEPPRKTSLPAQAQPPRLPRLDDVLLPIYAGLALALLLALLISVRLRRRRRRAEEETQAAQPPAEAFEARLDSLRQSVLADPRVAASVVKLWMQQP